MPQDLQREARQEMQFSVVLEEALHRRKEPRRRFVLLEISGLWRILEIHIIKI